MGHGASYTKAATKTARTGRGAPSKQSADSENALLGHSTDQPMSSVSDRMADLSLDVKCMVQQITLMNTLIREHMAPQNPDAAPEQVIVEDLVQSHDTAKPHELMGGTKLPDTVCKQAITDMADEFIKLAESKGLNSETIEVLQEQAINNADDLTLLSDDDIKKLKLKIAQTNLLKKWIEEIKVRRKTNTTQQQYQQPQASQNTNTQPQYQQPQASQNTNTQPQYQQPQASQNTNNHDESRCHNCYESNHTVRNCRHEGPIECYQCGREGHKSKHHTGH